MGPKCILFLCRILAETGLVWLLPMKIQTQKLTILTPVVSQALVAEGVRMQWGRRCPHQHRPNTVVDVMERYIIPGEPIVRRSLATLALQWQADDVSRTRPFGSSRSQKPGVCPSLLVDFTECWVGPVTCDAIKRDVLSQPTSPTWEAGVEEEDGASRKRT